MTTPFNGIIGRTIDKSQPAWPEPVTSRHGTPNIVIIMLDDTGFAQLGSYGSPIRTPYLDSLAEGGLRYNNFHTTALCSPTRASVLTGRNHHSCGMGCITEGATGYPGYNGQIPFETGFLSEILLEHGYNTYALGKWHLTPAHETSAAGPYTRWPLGRGFERFYGFMGGDTHQYYPELIYDNHQVEPDKTPEEGYHFTEDIADKAISFITDAKQVAPDKPFFLYFAPGATHAPHHVPQEWSNRYKGEFDEGWEAYRETVFARQKELGIIPAETELSRHDPDVKPWAACSPDERKLFARMMEVYAGFLEHTDYQIGRILEHLKQIGQFENTLVIALSDNGASSEGNVNGMLNINAWHNNVWSTVEENIAAIDTLGGPEHFNHYPWGWAWAGNTPFRRWKRETYRGGISDPLIVQWPAGIKANGEIRTQYLHAIDILPTVLDCLKIKPPQLIRGVKQTPIAGISFAHTFEEANAISRRETQYFEMLGHRAIYHKGWRAVCPYPGPSFTEAGRFFGAAMSAEALANLDTTGWELYHIAEDFAENHNIAHQYPSKLQELITLWYIEAEKYNVLPLDSRGAIRLFDERPQAAPSREHYTFYPHTQPVPGNATVNVLNRPHSITANVEIPPSGAEGVLLAFGGNEGGYVLYIQDNKLHYAQNYLSAKLLHLASSETISSGPHQLRFEFEPTGKRDVKAGKGVPGDARLYIDQHLVAQAHFEATVPVMYGLSCLLACGENPGSPVTPAYKSPFHFTGTLHYVTIDVSGKLLHDKDAEIRLMMARQ